MKQNKKKAISLKMNITGDRHQFPHYFEKILSLKLFM